jgi:hypothetical protein
MKYPSETEMDNMVVRQKDRIIRLINDGLTGPARQALAVVTELWETIGYGYKVKELRERMRREEDKVINDQ